MESKHYFIKEIYEIYDRESDKPFPSEVIVKIYQPTKTEENKNIHNIIEIKSKSGSIQLITEDYDNYQSWVKKISNEDFEMCLEHGDNYYHKIIKQVEGEKE